VKTGFRKLIFLLLIPTAFCQAQTSGLERNLKERWQLIPGPGGEVRTIYFSLDANQHKGSRLEIDSRKSFSVLVNGKLIGAGSHFVSYSLDSLAGIHTPKLRVTIHAPDAAKWLQTRLVYPTVNAEAGEAVGSPLRKDMFFLNFSILAVLGLTVFLIYLWRTNPKLTLDYFNFIKLFSMQERDENILASRVTASVNILFYAFVSYFGALLLMIIFHFAPFESPLAKSFQAASLPEAGLQWTLLALIIFGLLVVKLILIYLFSGLFNMAEIAPIQFFNYLRLFLFLFGVVGFLTMLFFIFKVQSPASYSGLFVVGLATFILWKALLFLKLIARLPFRVFHLFSYLCASEIIPFVVLIKGVFF